MIFEIADLKDWQARVIGWAKDRNLIEGSSPYRQVIKLREELAELRTAITEGDTEGIKDGVGDVSVVLAIIAEQVHMQINWDVVGAGWNENQQALGLKFFEESFEAVCLELPIYAVLFHVAEIACKHDLTYQECLEHAWNEIKDRTGRMVDGIFVKDA